MSEFELRRRLREMSQPREPSVDLWPAIAQRIVRAPVAVAAPPRARRHWPEAIAAMLAVAIGAAMFVAGGDRGMPASPGIAADATPRADDWSRREVQALNASFRAAVGEAQGSTPLPPALRGAATELDAAQAEIETALRQSPDSPYLLKLLRQTHERRLRLSLQAGNQLG